MAEATENNRGLTIKPVHFPMVVKVTAATVWGLGVVGSVLEILFQAH